jgi:hypothetical protein
LKETKLVVFNSNFKIHLIACDLLNIQTVFVWFEALMLEIKIN